MEQLESENRDLRARVRQLTREAKTKPSFLSLFAGVALGFIVGLWLVMH